MPLSEISSWPAPVSSESVPLLWGSIVNGRPMFSSCYLASLIYSTIRLSGSSYAQLSCASSYPLADTSLTK